MKNLNNKLNITNLQFDETYTYSNDVEYFTQIPEVNPIPLDSIICKTVTGIGATHSEIVSPRSSIIVLPHISIVTSKHEHYQRQGINTLAVYGKIKPLEIYNYVDSDNEFAKILTTPKGLNKIIYIMEHLKKNRSHRIDYKKLFFLLVDECHKIIQEANYRKDMTELMEHFFEFDKKAMVSATPIPPSDPRFEENNFKHIKVQPETIPKVPIELIHVNSLVNGLQTYFSENQSDCYCIFFNSLVGINSIIAQLGLTDYKVFCSRESIDLQRLRGELNTSFEIGELARFNFFTSSFFNGLDIIIDAKPNIVILTDYGFKNHTLIDPYTDTLQIIGRFRKKAHGDIPYNMVTHINNSSECTTLVSEEYALEQVKLSDSVYNHIKTLKLSLNGTAHHELFDQALATVLPYSKLIRADGELCHFLLDNYLDDKRVQNYYSSGSMLHTAYWDTKLYTVTNERKLYEKDEVINLQNHSVRYSKEMNMKIADTLLSLEDYLGLEIYHEQHQQIATLSFVLYDAYTRLGYETIKTLKYSKSKLDKELLKLNIEQGKNSFPVIDIIHRSFMLNKSYTWKYLKHKVQELFDEFNVNCIAKAKDIERYFDFVSTKEGESRVYVFTAHKQFPVSQRKHI